MNIKFLEVKRAYYADPENVVVRGRRVGGMGGWCIFIEEPAWNEDWEYELAPRTIRIGDIDVPEPVREALTVGQKYFIAGPDSQGNSYTDIWNDDSFDKRLLSRGLIHLTKEAAIEHAKALIIVSRGKV